MLTPSGTPGLTDTDRGILAIEQRTWQSRGAKALAICDQLGLTETRYYQRLSELIDKPEALRLAPAVVNLLHKRRARRLTCRAAGAGAGSEVGTAAAG